MPKGINIFVLLHWQGSIVIILLRVYLLDLIKKEKLHFGSSRMLDEIGVGGTYSNVAMA